MESFELRFEIVNYSIGFADFLLQLFVARFVVRQFLSIKNELV